MVEEKILNIVGIDYIISSDGHVYSTKNVGRGKYHKEIKQRENCDGYMDVTVGPNFARTTRKVHRLVALAFLPPPPNDSYEVDHKDRNRKNNNVDNLQWVTHKENVQKIPYAVGSAARSGSKNGRAINDESVVREIRKLYEQENKTIAYISKLYNVPYSTVFNIVKYKTWKNVN